MNLNWEYNKIRKDYTARVELAAFSIWINVSADQILVNVDDDNDSFSYGKFVNTANLEERLKEIEAIVDEIAADDLISFCSHLMTAIKEVK